MIKINLLGDETGRSNAFKYGIIGYVGSVIICLAVFFSLYQNVARALAEKDLEIARQKSRLAALKLQTAKVDELEKKKQILNSKLVLIAKLKRSKIGPVRVLDDLNVAVPAQVWLQNVAEKDNLIQIKGRARSNEDIAFFLRNLEGSDYFSQVELVKSMQMYYSKRTGKVSPTPDLQKLRSSGRATKEVTRKEGAAGQHWAVRQEAKQGSTVRAAVEEANVKIKEFVVTAKVNYAGKIKIAEAGKQAEDEPKAVRS